MDRRSPTMGDRHRHRERRRSTDRRRHRSGDRPDDDFERKLRDMRSKSAERKRLAKQLMKSLETPEEKRARRLAKKRDKQLRRNQLLHWPKDAIAYEDGNNPYGDPNLCKPFIWKRKLEKEGRANASTEELVQESRRVIESNMMQLAEIKQNRMMREMVREDIEMAQRDRDMQQMSTWIEQEDQFHLQQARERSKIRIKDERPEPIDYFAAYVYCFIENESWMPEGYNFGAPQEYCEDLTINEYRNLLADIQVYKKLQEGRYDQFWDDVATLVHDKCVLAAAAQGTGTDYRKAVSKAVLADIENMFTGKSVEHLTELCTQIRDKMRSLEDGLDISYWETLLTLIRVRIADCRLTELHSSLTSKWTATQSGDVKVKLEEEYDEPCSSQTLTTTDVEYVASRSDGLLLDAELEEKMMTEYRSGRYSPVYKQLKDLPKKAKVLTVDDWPTLDVDQPVAVVAPGELAKVAEFEAVARMGMDKDEVRFSVEEKLTPAESRKASVDRFKTRKPRYFNRVHTGFEWNKYNQTHYDLDNPPPKIVQGYKFNIFYPDLLEQVSPKFTVTPCQDDSDFAIIRFSTGPPYEDIAFRIVNREWEISQKKGYRCVFQNGIFQLWFQFKRYRYKR